MSKPAAIADLQDVANLAVQLADGYAAEAKAQQSPEDILEDIRLEDGKAAGAMHKQMLAELTAGDGGPCEAVACGKSAAFLSAAPGATIHLAEPDEALASEIASTARAVSAAFAAVEQRQETTEAMLSSLAASASL